MAERPQADETSSEGEVFRLLVANVRDYAIFVVDVEGRVQTWSPGAERLLGYRADEVIGRSADRFFTAEDVAAGVPRRELEEALAVGRGGDDRWHVRKDGTRFWSSGVATPLRDEAGVLRGFAKIMRDRTASRRAEEERDEVLALLDTLQRNAPVGFAFVDREFRYVRVNDALAAMDGRPAAELVGKTVGESVPDLWPQLEPLYRAVLEEGRPVTNGEVAGETPAAPGQVRHWLVNYYPVRVRGEVVGLGILVTDITERKRLVDELRQRAAQLAEADRLKDEFLAMLAHELRNPLAPIRTALHIMKQPTAGADLVGQMREMAERQVQHMARLLDDLLDVSRISRGRIELRPEWLDVTAVVNRAVEAVRPLFEERQHRLTVSLPPASLRVRGDPTRLEQVLANLLHNAAKYTDPGGQVWLTAEHAGGEVVLRVRDTGIGIDPAVRPKIFDLFVQAERRLDRSQGGVGIGLTLVRRLVELHGGTVAASSEGPGRGSEFIVRLPAAPDEPAAGGGGRTDPSTAHGPSRRVLVVDDNVDAADSVALLLRLGGHQARAAYDGPTALLVAQAFRPQVVLLDIGMPGMDGHEVARRLRQQGQTPAAVLVALTGWGQNSDREHSAEAGFDHHLVKPVEPHALEGLLAGLELPG